MTIAENIARIRANMAAAAREAGRDPKEILLVGASKMNDAAACREAVAAGIDALGRTGCRRWYRSWSSTPTTAPPCTSSATCSATKSSRWWAMWP
ncbi:MAG: hypothetical protein ACLTYN_13115 [Dysosmobacter welbionis]